MLKIILQEHYFCSFLFVVCIFLSFANGQHQFNDSANWEAFDHSTVTAVDTIGYSSVVYFDPYIYYVPCTFMNTSNGKILRFNTNTDFSNTSGYTVFNSKARLGQYVSNFFDGVIAEHFIIFIPQSYGIFLRFDTNQDFTNVSSYTMYDANSTFGILYAGSGCYDGSKFAYFPVYYNGPGIGFVGQLLKVDVSSEFNLTSSWSVFSLTAINSSLVGYISAMCVSSNTVLLVPNRSNSAFHNIHVRYDALSHTISYIDSAALLGYSDITSFVGACKLGNFVYYSPLRVNLSSNIYASTVLRYDWTKSLSDKNAFQRFDVSIVSGLNAKGFVGCVSDDTQFLYFVPFFNGSNFVGTSIRYDSTKPFNQSEGWIGFDFNPTKESSGVELTAVGYRHASFDSKYIYFAPSIIPGTPSPSWSPLVRYNTGLNSPTPSPTTSPTPKPTPIPTPIQTTTTTSSTTQTTTNSGNIGQTSESSDSSMPIIVIIIPIVVVVLVLAFVVFLVLFIRYRKAKKSQNNQNNTELDAKSETTTTTNKNSSQYQNVGNVFEANNKDTNQYQNVGGTDLKTTEYANSSTIGNSEKNNNTYANASNIENKNKNGTTYANSSNIENSGNQQQHQYANSSNINSN